MIYYKRNVGMWIMETVQAKQCSGTAYPGQVPYRLSVTDFQLLDAIRESTIIG